MYLNLLFAFGKIKIKQRARESCDPYKPVLPVMGENAAGFGGWLSFACFPILPPQFVCNLQITSLHSQLSPQKPRTSRCLCESSFWHQWGKVWEEEWQRGKGFLLKSPWGNRQVGTSSAAQGRRKEDKDELGFFREKNMELSPESRADQERGGWELWPVKAELQGREESHNSWENVHGSIPGCARLIQTNQHYPNPRREENLQQPMLLLRLQCRKISSQWLLIKLWRHLDHLPFCYSTAILQQDSPQEPNTRACFK